MRVGPFVLMVDNAKKGWDSIVCINLTGAPEVPNRFAYDRKERIWHLKDALQFLNQCRKPGDPEAIDVLVKLWPDLKAKIEKIVQDHCIKEILPDHQPEEPDEPPPIPF